MFVAFLYLVHEVLIQYYACVIIDGAQRTYYYDEHINIKQEDWVCLFIAVQNYVTQGNEGISKAIRGNANVFAIWRTGNMKELDLLMTELSGQIPKEKLLRAYHAVMNKDPDDRHACLFVDLNPKPHHPSPFRINYTDWLILDD